MPKVSVVIPCYNQGQYLDDAVESALAQSFQDLEILIVDDGSTDQQTINKCGSYNHAKIRVVTTANQGLASARNSGIAEAKGDYILPLDADDMISRTYIEEALKVLEEEPEVGIVYSKAKLFGAVNTDWPLPEYSLEEMLKNNIIFCTALFRKVDWELVGGYDPGMIYGWEDYDFWMSLLERGCRVKQLDATHFFYRVDPNSMVRSKEKWQKVEMFKRIYHRHTSFIGDHIDIWISTVLEHNEPTIVSRLYVNCGNGVSDSESVKQEINQATRSVTFNIARFTDRKEIRFDPTECPVCVKISSIELVHENGKTEVDIDTTSSNAFTKIDSLFMFDTEDPQIYFPLTRENLKDVEEIRIVFLIQSIKEQALRDIITFLSTESKSSLGSFNYRRLLGLEK